MKTPTITELLDDPVRFAQALGFELLPWQMDALRALAAPSTDPFQKLDGEHRQRLALAAPPVYKADDLKAVKVPERVTSAAGATAYTVARAAGAHMKAQEWLIAPDEVKMILDTTVRVGNAEGKNMVFNKRDPANKIAQIVNDRYNAKKAGS